MTSVERARLWLAEASRVVGSVDATMVARAVEALGSVWERGRTVFLAGNGGSAATASHFALDLQKSARRDGAPSRAVSLTDSVGLITAWGNDVSFERVFAEQIRALAEPGDALVVISVSGSSPNLIAALRAAREKDLITVGLLGKDGGAARALVDHAVVVSSQDYGWVESTHLVLEHVITYALLDGWAADPAAERTDSTPP